MHGLEVTPYEWNTHEFIGNGNVMQWLKTTSLYGKLITKNVYTEISVSDVPILGQPECVRLQSFETQ